MTGKGDEIRPYDRKKFNENFDKIFGSRSTAPITKINIEFDMDGNNHTLEDVYERILQLIKSRQLNFKSTTRYD